MYTFPEAARASRPQGHRTKGEIIARGLVLAVLLLWLGACSTLRLAYNQAPSLGYWWIDGYADLNDTQSAVLRKDIDAFFAWHRASELPGYIERLQHWQQLAYADTTSDASCVQFDHLRDAYLRLIERSLEPMARLALSLTPTQIQHLQRKYSRNNKEFEDDYVKVNDAERTDRLLDKATDRYETLYGSLSEPQVRLLREHIRRSPFDAQRINSERLRRQSDMLKTLRDLQADRNSTPATATAALKAWHHRVMRSPTPGFAAYSDTLVRQACDQFTLLHNTTTAAQRQHALALLKNYESDLRILVDQR
jgi:uncharacterized membrane-anchored protein YhcB (DUF1043 family)